MDTGNIWVIARKELRDALRNRWFVLFAAAFGLLAFALSSLTQPSGTLIHISNYSRTAASLINLVLLFVPLIGLTLGASKLASERETGSLAYLMSQPVTHAEVLLGKYLGLSLALFASLVIGFGLAGVAMALRGTPADAGGYFISVVLACLLAMAMLSLGMFISVIAKTTTTALGGGLFAWLVFVFVGDLGIMGTVLVTQMDVETVFFLASINPLQLFKMSAILNIQANLEVLGPAGLYAVQTFGDGLFFVLVGILIIWIIVPLGGAIYIFSPSKKLGNLVRKPA